MSNFLARGKFDYLTRFGFGNKTGLQIFSGDENPKGANGLLRRISSVSEKGNFTNDILRSRAWIMFKVFNDLSEEKPNFENLKNYTDIASYIGKKFINKEGMFSAKASENLVKALSEIRLKMMNDIMIATGCGEVNVIFKSPVNSPVFREKITVYVNNFEAVRNCNYIPFKFKLDGVELNKSTTVTIVIPLKFVQDTIEQSFRAVIYDLKKENISRNDATVVSGVVARFAKLVGYDLFDAFVAAIYKDFIFMNFAKDVSSYANNLITYREPVVVGETQNNLVVEITSAVQKCCTGVSYNIPILYCSDIVRIMKEEGIDELDPSIILDIFEITNEEITTFVSNFVAGGDVARSTHSPHTYCLRNEYESYTDEESRISSSLVYVTRMNYAIIFLMLFSKNSIKESARFKYCQRIESEINSVEQYSMNSKITDNKGKLIEEIRFQKSLMESLANDIIKLKKFSSGVLL